MSKITIKHYLNTDLKPIKSPLGNEYKIYFLLRYLNQNTKIKSLISNTFTETEYLEIDQNEILNSWQKKEILLCESTILNLEKCNYTFDIKTFMQFYEFAKYPILENFESFIEWKKNSYDSRNSDYYTTINFDNQIQCFQKLKKTVYNNPNFINNEIYLGNYKEIKKELSKIKIEIFERKIDDNKDISIYIEPKFELKKYNFLDYFINEIMIGYLFSLPKIDILPLKSLNERLEKTIINSFTDN